MKRLSALVQDCRARAEAGAAESQYDLGILYSTGKGVPLDYVAAHKWFNLAAMQGRPDARDRRAELAAQMSAADVGQALRGARDWIARQAAPAAA